MNSSISAYTPPSMRGPRGHRDPDGHNATSLSKSICRISKHSSIQDPCPCKLPLRPINHSSMTREQFQQELYTHKHVPQRSCTLQQGEAKLSCPCTPLQRTGAGKASFITMKCMNKQEWRTRALIALQNINSVGKVPSGL